MARSPRLVRGVVLVHGASAALIASCYPASLATASMLVAIAAHALHSVWRVRTLDVDAVLLDANDNWHLTLADGSVMTARLLGQPFVTAWLTVLRFLLQDGRARTVVMLSDNADADGFRRLRVRLRFRHKP